MGELPGKIALSRFLQEDPLYAQQQHWHGGHHYPGDHSDPAHQTGAVLFFLTSCCRPNLNQTWHTCAKDIM